MIDLDLYEAKKLYPFQVNTVTNVLDELRKNGANFNLLYQLPTGGGKTVIFSDITKRYIEEWGKKVLILTHRIELSVQKGAKQDQILQLAEEESQQLASKQEDRDYEMPLP